MFRKDLVPMCDFTGVRYEKPVVGAKLYARGATGRWCCVMYVGPEYMKENNIEPLEGNAFFSAWFDNPNRQPDDWLEE